MYLKQILTRQFSSLSTRSKLICIMQSGKPQEHFKSFIWAWESLSSLHSPCFSVSEFGTEEREMREEEELLQATLKMHHPNQLFLLEKSRAQWPKNHRPISFSFLFSSNSRSFLFSQGRNVRFSNYQQNWWKKEQQVHSFEDFSKDAKFRGFQLHETVISPEYISEFPKVSHSRNNFTSLPFFSLTNVKSTLEFHSKDLGDWV